MKSINDIIKGLNALHKDNIKFKVFDVIEKAFNEGKISEDIFEKAKYIRREGSPGNYTYIYKEGEGPGSSKKTPEKETSTSEKKESSKEKVLIDKLGNKIEILQKDVQKNGKSYVKIKIGGNTSTLVPSDTFKDRFKEVSESEFKEKNKKHDVRGVSGIHIGSKD